jgi:hypothetical protein
MRPHFLAFRRTLPGGMIVLVSLEMVSETVVHGLLQVERRKDPARQLFNTAPVIARATGTSKDDVLRQLRALADDDAELAVQIAAWEAEHPPIGRGEGVAPPREAGGLPENGESAAIDKD